MNLNKAASLAEVYALDTGAATPFTDTGEISLGVDSQVVILHIKPQGYAAPTPVSFTANFSGDTVGATPAGWTPGSGDTWQVKASGTDNFLQNTNASGSNVLAKPLGATASSLTVDFDTAWQFGGTSPNGSYSLTSGIDLLNSSNNGYRILLHQGNSGNAANDGALTQIFKVTGGVASGTALASSTGYNKNGSGTTPAWSHVRVVRDGTSGAIQVYEDIDNDGDFNVVAKASDGSYGSFSTLQLVVGNVNVTEGARFDNIVATTPTVTVATTDATAGESGGDSGFFVFSRTGATTGPLTVSYVLGGSATPGTDLPLVATGNITFGVGEPTKTLPITPTNDGIVEGDERLSLRIIESSAYHVGQARSGDIRFKDDAPDLVVTGVTWTPNNLGPTDAVTFHVTVQNSGNVSVPAGVATEIRWDTFGSPSIAANTPFAIPAGGSLVVNLPSYNVGVGNWAFRAIIDGGDEDAAGAIAESDGDNNVLYGFLQKASSRTADDFSAGTLGTLPTNWSAGDNWQTNGVGSERFLENVTTGTGLRKTGRTLAATSTGSWRLDFKHTWRQGGTGADGSATLGIFADVVDSSGNGYRIRFRQGNGGVAGNNSSLTQIFKMTAGSPGASAIGSGAGFNLKGWATLGLGAPNWRNVEVLFDKGTHRITVLGDLGSGLTQLATVVDLTGPTYFSQLNLGADNLTSGVGPEFDDVVMDLIP